MTAPDKKATGVVGGTKQKIFIDDKETREREGKEGKKKLLLFAFRFFFVRHGEKTQCGIWHFYRLDSGLCLVTNYRELLQRFDSHQ